MAHRTTYAAERPDLLQRLRKAEGQVRGLQRMIEEDRYCLEVVQQVNAVTAGLREVSLIALEAHLQAVVAEAVSGEEDGTAAVAEMIAVLRRTLRP